MVEDVFEAGLYFFDGLLGFKNFRHKFCEIRLNLMQGLNLFLDLSIHFEFLLRNYLDF